MINKINQTFKDIYNAVDVMEAAINEQRAEIKRLRHAEEIDQLLIKELLGINEQLRKDSYEANGISLKYEDRYFVALVELDEARRERDEARKTCCELEARIIVLEEDRRDTSNKFGTNPCSEIILADSPLARYPKEIAKRKGWDCFKETP